LEKKLAIPINRYKAEQIVTLVGDLVPAWPNAKSALSAGGPKGLRRSSRK
jgi:hypothetical protein